MKVYLDSLGCRLNLSEVETLARRLVALGWQVVSQPEEAQVYVVNTCAVTVQAERKSRSRVRSLAAANPQAAIAVLGCYATLAPRRCAAWPQVTWVIPNAEKERAAHILTEAQPRTGAGAPAGAFDGSFLRTRAFIKVQEGCDNHCTYCVTRRLRGPGRSRAVGEVVRQVRARVAEGYQEVILTGVNLGSYGRHRPGAGGLAGLVQTLLRETDVARLRLSSVEPWDLDEAFFTLWEDARLCRQLHLPLQAGCDATLRRMGRPITTARFARLVEAARATIPDLALTTDVIAGFPGEDEAAFEAGLAFVDRLAFARLHVFPYSPRPGTPAAEAPGQVPGPVRRARARRLRRLGARHAAQFRAQFLGREMPVLWERPNRAGLWSGLTDNYIRVVAPADEDLHNQIRMTRLLEARKRHLVGALVSQE
jgi:threonylcarbamoyladenosine tRNA methylthiotransferase MtaB